MAVNRLKMAGCSEVLCDAQSDHFKHYYYYCGTIWQRQIDRPSERVDKTGRDWPRCVCVCVCVCSVPSHSLVDCRSVSLASVYQFATAPVLKCLLFLVLPLFMSPLIFRCLRRQTDRGRESESLPIDWQGERERLAKWSISIDHLVVMVVPLVTWSDQVAESLFCAEALSDSVPLSFSLPFHSLKGCA